MAENKPLSAEQQLLKLIEDSGSGAGPEGVPLPRKGRRPGLSLTGFFDGLRGRFSFLKRKTKKKTATARRFTVNFVVVNSALGIIAAMLVVLIGTDAFFSWRKLKMAPKLNFKDQNAQADAVSKAPALKDSAYYLNEVMERDIFKGGKIAKKEAEKKETSSADANEVTKNFSLVGISWSANPDVIIEDKANQRTHFVKRGQMVGDDVRVEAVYKDHVILSYEGEEFELR